MSTSTACRFAGGEQFVTLLGAANRDPARVRRSRPVRRRSSRSGADELRRGIHYCLGAALARAEGAVVFDRCSIGSR
jgi:cytochrome P450